VVQGSRFSSAGSMASTGTDLASYLRIAGLGLGLALGGAALVWWSRRERGA
jgi:LPXTG-motif cell wall-anchored protein